MTRNIAQGLGLQFFGIHRNLERRPDRDHLVDPGVHVTMLLKWIFRKGDRGMDWIDLAQDRNRWRALVNVAMNIRIP